MLDWSIIGLERIRTGKTPEGTPLLQLFVKEYKELTGVKTVNVQCPDCLRKMFKTYQLKTSTMAKNETAPKFVIKKKYLGAPIGFGTGKFVQSLTPDEETVAKILTRHSLETFFQVYPKDLKGKKLEEFLKKYTPQQKSNSEQKSNKSDDKKANGKTDATSEKSPQNAQNEAEDSK